MINKDKQYRTRDGREVRIYATDGRKWTEVHGAILENNGWAACHWDSNGKHDHISFNSLVEVKPRIQRTVWLNVYDNEVIHGGWRTKEEADNISHRNRVACIKLDLDFEEGEGL